MSLARFNTKLLILAIACFTLAIFLTVGFFLTRYYISPPSSDSTQSTFTIQKGEALTNVAMDLEKQGFIRSALAFRVIVQISGYQNQIQAGTFHLAKNLSLKEVAYSLTRGTTDRHITILEGWRIEEIAEYLDAQKIIKKQTFLDAAADYDASKYSFIPSYPSSDLDQPYRRLEGYLFPDTYELPVDVTASQIITKMLDNFAVRLPQDQRSPSTKLTFAQTIILASIVEREAKTDADRATVAGILLKRFLTPGWRLEADDTIQFALGYDSADATWWKRVLTAKDLQINSPYNTKIADALPPTPIDSPSLSSIKATLNPTNTNYWFYITGTDGTMHYAKTLDQQNLNIAKYIR